MTSAKLVSSQLTLFVSFAIKAAINVAINFCGNFSLLKYRLVIRPICCTHENNLQSSPDIRSRDVIICVCVKTN